LKNTVQTPALSIVLTAVLAITLVLTPVRVKADYAQAIVHLDNEQYVQSFSQLFSLAKLGNIPAQLIVAESYAKGFGTKRDLQQAYAWSLMAIENNHPDANSQYLQYRRLTPKKRQAKVLFNTLNTHYGLTALNTSLYPQLNLVGQNAELQRLLNLAVNGNGKAQYELFECLLSGRLCQADKSKAQKWLTYAQQQGQTDAMLFVAKAHLKQNNGWVSYSPPTAIELLKQLMADNHLPAMAVYCQLLATSEDQQIKNPQQAIKTAQQAMALDNNNPNLLASLGSAYFELNQVNKGQQYLMDAIKEADIRQWPIDDYVNALEAYQRAALLEK
jgi:TPR repeat protein